MSQKFPFKNGTSHRDSILIPWNRAELEKNHFLCLKTHLSRFDIYSPEPSKTREKSLFMPENIFPGTNLYPSLHFHGFEAKQKNSHVQFSRHLISTTTAATPLVTRFCYNSAKMCLIDENKTSPSLEVLNRAVLELWSII